ncbi:DarT ssDNA thymidine ADP-ribosyltransferase family protein [Sedimentitalea sp. JM2-8]|uniref:DarT ssDNA thymidine ADP-ribosyltransferase family protein n=1 Tax=Sedimentitalea xiamensis TaxID=3050037 RepID=A0ABT7F8N8_9RHOB|nr:DarT ssDNA thymidine ADP-ribosyltransferase family protein [Sedimentitalea xiamensis]MDK3071482.1 DarT ssDNA thymidine ADP-ribosyltransferase family protein [Sedimentitalea xiamensis]
MSAADSIREIAQRRGITKLLHFTALENVESIVQHGLLSRADMAIRSIATRISASERIDRLREAISLSIEQPNFEMMKAKYRRLSGDVAWVLLHLSPEILWNNRCRFAYTNAAKTEILRGGALSDDQAFEDMFTRRGRHVPYIISDNRPPSHPLDPHAEVQVLERIAPHHITGAEVWGYKIAVVVDDALKSLPGEERNVESQSDRMCDYQPYDYDPPGYIWRPGPDGSLSYSKID